MPWLVELPPAGGGGCCEVVPGASRGQGSGRADELEGNAVRPSEQKAMAGSDHQAGVLRKLVGFRLDAKGVLDGWKSKGEGEGAAARVDVGGSERWRA